MNITSYLKKLTGLLYLKSFGKIHLRNNSVVLMLHRVIEDKQKALLPHNNPLCIDQRTFENLILFLNKHFDVVDLENILEGKKSKKPKLAITFDDGWKDNVALAYPILLKHKTPATIFLSTDYIGENRGFWWQSVSNKLWENPNTIHEDSLQTALNQYSISFNKNLLNTNKTHSKSLLILEFIDQLKDIEPKQLHQLADTFFYDNEPDAMTWNDVNFLERSGLIRFAPHGAQHYILTQLSKKEYTEDIIRAHHTIHKHCQHPLKVFCYPNGNNNADIQNILVELGYTHAFTTRPGLINIHQDNYNLPRIDVSQKAAQQPSLLGWRIFQGSRRATSTEQSSSPLAI